MGCTIHHVHEADWNHLKKPSSGKFHIFDNTKKRSSTNTFRSIIVVCCIIGFQSLRRHYNWYFKVNKWNHIVSPSWQSMVYVQSTNTTYSMVPECLLLTLNYLTRKKRTLFTVNVWKFIGTIKRIGFFLGLAFKTRKYLIPRYRLY